jgi:hypothetical protein
MAMDAKPRVLIVDDFPDGREVVAEYLAFRGFGPARGGPESDSDGR